VSELAGTLFPFKERKTMENTKDFEQWKHYTLTVQNLEGKTLTEEQLRKWANDPDRMLECVFCQIVEPPSFFQVQNTDFLICPRCMEHKGIQPHIPEWSNL